MLASRDPQSWGPSFWAVMQTVADVYPESDPTEQLKTSTKSFYESFQDLLPCEQCRVHYSEALLKFPLDEAIKSKNALVKWVLTVKSLMPNIDSRNIIREARPQSRSQGPRARARIQPRSVKPTFSQRQQISQKEHQIIRQRRQQQRNPRKRVKDCNCGTKK